MPLTDRFATNNRYESDLSIGNRIRRERLLSGKTPEILAQAIGISADELKCHELGQKRLDARKLALIVAILGIPLS